MRLYTEFEHAFFNLRNDIRKLKENEPTNKILSKIDLDLWKMAELYEKENQKQKEENETSVKILLNRILKALHEE